MSIDVVSPDGTVSALEYWSVVSNEFSAVGRRAEWRVVKNAGKAVPIALIVPFHVDHTSESRDTGTDTHKPTVYLVVAKIVGQGSCVTAKIQPGPDAAAAARRAADVAAESPCLAGR